MQRTDTDLQLLYGMVRARIEALRRGLGLGTKEQSVLLQALKESQKQKQHKRVAALQCASPKDARRTIRKRSR